MMKFVVLAAFVATALAQTKMSTDADGNMKIATPVNGDVVIERREVASVSIKDMLDGIAGNTAQIKEIQKNSALYTSAQTFMTSLAADTIKATTEAKVGAAEQAKDIKSVIDDVAGLSKTIDTTVADLKESVTNSIKNGEDKIAAAAKKASDDAATAAAALKKSVDDALKPVKGLSDTVAALEKASQRSGGIYEKYPTFQLMEWQKTKNDRQDGRVFYKVDFNPSAMGWYQCDRRELITACKDLSALLKSRDGKDRALKPACDHPSYCRNGKGVRLSGSYLSNMGECGRARKREGYGLSERMVTGTLMYNSQHHWSGCGMLVNYGRSCAHTWARQEHGSTRNGQSTLCTGSNAEYKTEPK
jgi:hypothetical protein